MLEQILLLQHLRDEGFEALPSEAAAWCSFQALGHRPEEFLHALRQLRASATSGLARDQLLPMINATLRSSAADLELLKVEQIGGLATAIFDRVARSGGPARGIFSTEAAASYGQTIGREVRVEEIQPVVNEPLGANVLMRIDHGLNGVTDPFVQEIWRERQGEAIELEGACSRKLLSLVWLGHHVSERTPLRPSSLLGGASRVIRARHRGRWLCCAPHPCRGRALDPPPAG